MSELTLCLPVASVSAMTVPSPGADTWGSQALRQRRTWMAGLQAQGPPFPTSLLGVSTAGTHPFPGPALLLVSAQGRLWVGKSRSVLPVSAGS